MLPIGRFKRPKSLRFSWNFIIQLGLQFLVSPQHPTNALNGVPFAEQRFGGNVGYVHVWFSIRVVQLIRAWYYPTRWVAFQRLPCKLRVNQIPPKAVLKCVSLGREGPLLKCRGADSGVNWYAKNRVASVADNILEMKLLC